MGLWFWEVVATKKMRQISAKIFYINKLNVHVCMYIMYNPHVKFDILLSFHQ